MTLWHDGDVLELLKEGATIQGTLKSVNTRNTIGEISKKFVIKMQQGNINGAIKLTNNMQNGVLPINKKYRTIGTKTPQRISCYRQCTSNR